MTRLHSKLWLLLVAYYCTLLLSSNRSEAATVRNTLKLKYPTSIVFGLPGVKTTDVSNLLLSYSESANNSSHRFEELNDSNARSEFCTAIETKHRIVISAFGFDQTGIIPSEVIYDVFNDTLASVDYKVDVALFVVDSAAQITEGNIEFFQIINEKMLQKKIENKIIVCKHCEEPMSIDSQILEVVKISGLSMFKLDDSNQSLARFDQTLENLKFSRNDLRHIAKPEFKNSFTDSLLPELAESQLKHKLANKKVIILLGETGTGKSTLGNCIVNRVWKYTYFKIFQILEICLQICIDDN